MLFLGRAIRPTQTKKTTEAPPTGADDPRPPPSVAAGVSTEIVAPGVSTEIVLKF